MAARILVVDDDEDIREFIISVLSEAGYQSVAAPHGAEALKVLKAGGIDILITDIYMPVMDGIQLTREARRLLPDLPILALSGGTGINEQEVGILEMVRRFGANHCLEKPFAVEELLDLLTKALNELKKTS